MRLADVNAAVADENRGGQRQAVAEDDISVGQPIAVGIPINLDAIAAFDAGLGSIWIFIKLDNPEAAFFVEAHGDRIDDIRLGRKQPHFKPRRHHKSLLRLGWRERRLSRAGVGFVGGFFGEREGAKSKTEEN